MMKLGMLGGPGFEKKDKEPAKEEASEKPEKAEAGDDEDLSSKAASAAVKTLFAAFKSGDVGAGTKALKAFMSACSE